MRIGILGSGNAGRTLGHGLLRCGHDVRIGTRDPRQLDGWLAEAGSHASVSSGADCARWAELIVISMLWVVYQQRTGKLHHAFKLLGK